ncbi:hypothetical protein pdam_00015971, partial [Pocillopora damicornis]
MSSSVVKREWLGLEGHIQALNSNCGSLCRIPTSCFMTKKLARLHQIPNQQGGKEGKDYQLFPPRDVCVFDWVASLKEATRLASKQHSEASFERGAGGGSIMGRLRNSLRRKKKVTRALSDTSKVGSNVNGSASSDTTGDHAEDPSLKLETKLKTRVQRSKSFPHEESQIVELKLMPSFNEQEKEPAVEAEEAVSCDPVCENSCEKISVQIPPKDGKIAENEEERKRQPIVTESIEVQTEPITVEELLSFQQQKLIKELEIEVCKLKCEVISLIQGSIKIPLKDDDLADWQLIEDIRYKDRIYQLLREARLYNPSLPNFDSTSASSSFRDSYGFIHGARESESELFHFLCRELKQHYSSFYQNRDGHARLWSQYVKARQQESKDVVFNEQGMKALLREGIPRSCRSEVWRSAMAQKVEHLKKEKGRDYYQKLLLQVERRKNLSANHPLGVTENQIKCDLLRTLPNNERFRSADSEEVKKLSRILHAFCVHRPDINYLQGMNFIVAMCLLFMDEEDAFWSFVAVSEVYLKNYFDKALSGALADQTAMRIWDCFVFEGREALFRIAVGLMKVQQPALLQLSCPLEIMQYMKRAARVTYDKDQLFKSSYEDVKVFPTIETLDEKQAKYLGGADTRLDERSITRDERTRSRVSSFTVEIPNQEKLEKPDQHEILECALATSRVWKIRSRLKQIINLFNL